ncbi:FAD-dependent oxidoreductase [Mesorhizobium sp. M5C.F.Ca.IN.020.29.1.1]|uniref:FAD-dependent oxidoreductase n=1 Tax=unclassified Mesorhizobium TaxID=325217 RepID=UPI000FCBFA39|nr:MULTISPECIES: FAD-dependent oxidoreductase [unclassified Mesorhizobium]RUV58572.1 FAD-dependent oxidoreductase [Mesorhizobium sp. M5C.F.Ca.IN.020.29.1.1]TIM82754.1 MAG: FAD-dependent oxidoreductase [Mesorhizobium sp.]
MNVSDERTVSLWAATEVAPDAVALGQSEQVDVVVVGSGIAGLSVAYELAVAGQKVAVLDRGRIGSGMTARTTAHLSSVCDDYFSELTKLRGEELARMYYQSQSAAIDRIQSIQESESIACDFRRLDGFLFPASGRQQSDIKRQLDAGLKIGVDVEKIRGVPLAGFSDAQALRYANQATFHPLKYLRGLAVGIRSRGGALYADTVVEKVEETDRGVRATTVSGFTVSAKSAVVATNSPINDRVALHTKQAPYRTYAMSFEIARDTIPDALYWDTEDPYHYVRLQPGEDRTDFLIVGGEDHKTGQADDAGDRFAALAAWTKRLVPDVGVETNRWSGQVMETVDYAGFIGRNPGNRRVFVATGDSGQGITHGVVAGLLISDLILKGESRWRELYEPSRKTAGAIGDYLSENATALKSFAEYIAPGEIDSVDKLRPGEGAIVREGLTKIAAFRDDDGTLYKRSAACTHIGCHVHWNSLERCWDCPCHGSHFAIDGTALNGPAVSPLASLD